MEHAEQAGMTVSSRFKKLLSRLMLTSTQRDDGRAVHRSVRCCLNKHYWGSRSETENSLLVGSWGKRTEIRPPRDIDVLFVLPAYIKDRFDKLPEGRNKQSELLQDVKAVLKATYPRTKMKADGQVVVVPFNKFSVEVVPAFPEDGILGLTGNYLICDTNGGGAYKVTAPKKEIERVTESNRETLGNTRDLVRMMKRWQSHCNVTSLKSFVVELLAMEFLSTWAHAGGSAVLYDWMVRDFFAYLCDKADWWYVSVPGTGEQIRWCDADWKSKAETALGRANKACDYEASDKEGSNEDAWWEWQKIFGEDVPLS